MNVLIGCEFSGMVRQAFRLRGHNCWSCDILPAEDNSVFHYQCSIRSNGIWVNKWDLVIFFPPCTHLASSGARWFKNKVLEQRDAVCFVKRLMEFPCGRIAIENPIGVLSTRWRKPDQIIQPWMFGHGETKATCLWLKNLPLLKPTNIVDGRVARVHREPPSKERWKNRSRTLPGIAQAMAEQWGGLAELPGGCAPTFISVRIRERKGEIIRISPLERCGLANMELDRRRSEAIQLSASNINQPINPVAQRGFSIPTIIL